MKTQHILIISATVLLSVLTILYFQFYTTTIKLNEQKLIRLKQEQIRQDQIMQRTNCMTGALQDYNANWNLAAKQLQRTNGLLPNFIADKLNQDYQTEQELCVKKYPIDN